jgi:hypothetical protein
MEKRMLELEGKIDTLREEINRTVLAGKELYRDYAKVRWGVEPGVVVTRLSSIRGEPIRVVSIDVPCCFSKYTFQNRPWVTGNPKKKDGTWGKAVRNVFGDWEVVK